MNFLTVKQFSEIWQISERRIIKLCTENRIPGAIKNGKSWSIPENAIKPADKRNNVFQYINTEKRIAIINLSDELKGIVSLLNHSGYIVDVIENKEIKHKYYEGLIFISNSSNDEKEKFIKEFSNTMNCDSSIVYFTTDKSENLNFIKKLSKEFKQEIGLRINAIKLIAPLDKNILINYDEIIDDIVDLSIRFKNITGTIIETDGNYLEFGNDGKSKILSNGEFYKVIENYFKRLNQNSHVWCASIMLEDEWTEEPKEMKFRVSNIDAANRGTYMERIFIFKSSRIKDFKDNNTLKIFMQSNIHTMYVDYDLIMEKEPQLFDVLGDGWDGIDDTTLICDVQSENQESRGYICINKREIKKAYEAFLKLKTYAKDLKDILK